jgi:CRP/FNR family cyclic AMP-dependent transcriptional regulator
MSHPTIPAKSDVTGFLRNLPIFGAVSENQLLALARVSRLQNVPKGAVLFCQSAEATAAYVVTSGCIDLILATPDGRELTINTMGPGDIFGELGVITGRPRSTGAIAREASQVIAIPRRDFLVALEADPPLMRKMLETTSRRLGISSQREAALAFLSASARLARVLLQLSVQHKIQGDLVVISQQALAQHVGVTRQTVAKVLGQWRRKGWIITGRGKIMLVNRPALHRLADEEVI